MYLLNYTFSQHSPRVYIQRMAMVENIAILVLCIIQTVFSIIPITLHIIGIYLLRKISSYPRNQKLYLIHLSIMEILFIVINNNILVYLKIFEAVPVFTSYIPVSVLCLIAVPWCIIEMLLILDRLAQVCLNIKYDVYINALMTNAAVVASWASGGVLFLVMFGAKYVLHIDSHRIMHMFVIQIFMGNLLIVATITYAYIYYKIKCNTKRNVHIHLFHRRETFVPFWIVFTFVWLFLLPDILQLIFEENIYLYIGGTILFDCGCIADVLIYMFMNQQIKNKFLLLIQWKGRKSKELKDYELDVLNKNGVQTSQNA